jgi:chemotaxis response regulator CheB
LWEIPLAAVGELFHEPAKICGTLNLQIRKRRRMPMKKNPFAKDFPVVCVAGSAGGLDAYIRLLTHLPADMGVAIVIVNHITIMPTMLHEILPSYTKCRLS